jgi:glycopeptide antibiotics resistance protein
LSRQAHHGSINVPKRLITALVLIGYSALLIKVVVFKGKMRVPDWARPEREERAEGRQQDQGRGASRGDNAAEGRGGRRMRPASSALPDSRLSTSRFAPLHANYVPFKTILPQLRGQPRWSSAIINVLGNTVLFMPVGFLALLVFRKMTSPKTLVLAVAVGVTMEVMEGVFRVGIVDVDDVILNAAGVMSGFYFCRFWLRRRDLVRAHREMGSGRNVQP